MAEVRTEIIDGKKIAGEIRQQAKRDVAALKESYPDFPKPKLVIVQVSRRKLHFCDFS